MGVGDVQEEAKLLSRVAFAWPTGETRPRRRGQSRALPGLLQLREGPDPCVLRSQASWVRAKAKLWSRKRALISMTV